MMKQIIIAGGVIFSAIEMVQADCLTESEKQHYGAISTKANDIKDEIREKRS